MTTITLNATQAAEMEQLLLDVLYEREVDCDRSILLEVLAEVERANQWASKCVSNCPPEGHYEECERAPEVVQGWTESELRLMDGNR